MKKQLYTLAILSILGLPTHLFAVHTYRLIQAPTGKLILILGDIHKDNKTISAVAEELKKVRLKKPLPMVVELNEVLPKEHLIIESCSIKTMYALSDSFTKSGGSPITLSRCEPRGEMSDVLDFLRRDILSFCREVITHDQFIEHARNLHREEKVLPEALSNTKKKEWNRKKVAILRDHSFSRSGGPGFTVSAYRQYLDKNYAFLKQCRDKQKEKAWFEFFDALLQDYATTMEAMKKSLAGGNEKEHMVDCFNRGVMACETPEALLDWGEHWSDLYLKKADYSVLDAALAMRIADAALDNAPLCLVVGEMHANKLVHDLTTGPLGFKLLEEATAFHQLSFFVQTDYESGSDEVREFEAKLKVVMRKVLEPLELRCAACPKTDGLKACSSCKEVYYCGVGCQKKAWKDHKPVCQPVKVKVVNL